MGIGRVASVNEINCLNDEGVRERERGRERVLRSEYGLYKKSKWVRHMREIKRLLD